ncbi:hypothetical protein QBC46DRAFT_418096 [Diplogelasinospora grovesii]|uniref:Uncharacterized protein n=1 Tax=Diplogelasinospora grovesii TaxID=303347 RepID=A0AAN6N2W9_9PEZI|nr:hypothetical protein QBC46DRAFT_418096 [Diplogelasinospora grovesii]
MQQANMTNSANAATQDKPLPSVPKQVRISGAAREVHRDAQPGTPHPSSSRPKNQGKWIALDVDTNVPLDTGVRPESDRSASGSSSSSVPTPGALITATFNRSFSNISGAGYKDRAVTSSDRPSQSRQSSNRNVASSPTNPFLSRGNSFMPEALDPYPASLADGDDKTFDTPEKEKAWNRDRMRIAAVSRIARDLTQLELRLGVEGSDLSLGVDQQYEISLLESLTYYDKLPGEQRGDYVDRILTVWSARLRALVTRAESCTCGTSMLCKQTIATDIHRRPDGLAADPTMRGVALGESILPWVRYKISSYKAQNESAIRNGQEPPVKDYQTQLYDDLPMEFQTLVERPKEGPGMPGFLHNWHYAMKGTFFMRARLWELENLQDQGHKMMQKDPCKSCHPETFVRRMVRRATGSSGSNTSLQKGTGKKR